MPVNVRRFCTSVLLAFTVFGVALNAQTQPQAQATAQPPATTAPVKAPTSAEIMRDRISKAKAFIAVRNYNAAIYELDNIRRETSDQSVQAVTTVLLMNSYLEQGDYKRAQDFLTQAFNVQKTNRSGSADIYHAVAGQVIKGARTKADRYKSLGLMVADRNLPLEAVTDIERMRETLELVITQAKEMGKDAGKMGIAMATLEEATGSRSALARDDYDARRWRDEVADSREQLAVSRSVITNAVDGTTSPVPVTTQTVANNPAGTPAVSTQTVSLNLPQQSAPQPIATAPPPTPAPTDPNASAARDRSIDEARRQATNTKPADNLNVANGKAAPTVAVPVQEQPKPIVVQSPQRENDSVPQSGPPAETAKNDGPMDVGPLIEYATKRASPVYPPVARSMRAAGVVRVEVTVDESGEVAEVQRTSGPTLLQAAAKDAVRKWRFKPFTRDGQPVKATGFVNFNFSL